MYNTVIKCLPRIHTAQGSISRRQKWGGAKSEKRRKKRKRKSEKGGGEERKDRWRRREREEEDRGKRGKKEGRERDRKEAGKTHRQNRRSWKERQIGCLKPPSPTGAKHQEKGNCEQQAQRTEGTADDKPMKARQT